MNNKKIWDAFSARQMLHLLVMLVEQYEAMTPDEPRALGLIELIAEISAQTQIKLLTLVAMGRGADLPF